MKKRLFTSAILAVAVAISWQPAKAQLKLPPASSAQTITQGLGIGTVTLTYSRPNMNGRKIFGGLEPYDTVWRTGANNIPSLTFDSEVTIAGNKVAPGTYGLLTIPGTDEWTVIFTKNSQQWGAYSYKQEEDLFRFKVSPKQLDESVETFIMTFSDVTAQSTKLNIAWENTQIGFDLTVDQDAEIMASIDEAMKGERKPYMQAAQYYYANNKDIQKALEWMNEADKAPNPAPYIKYWKARIQLKAGDKKGAAATATEGIAIAKQQNNPEYVRLNGQVLAETQQ
ncbi:DUF2911 domain-containing protein [Parapedobacter koreensis]|uniref:DUF2911 domain-containing protein n=1 Tax=Parapedobacter koreensis TaxID=332977 RepID=A0A1H7G699_9SPHI|nr:DUF2911 domain-containing protein [Parapedobacter koreensis]SEK31990.1 Protein of unknown function [Parapedobacter koreensis]